MTEISIHALLAESDYQIAQKYMRLGISIHALLAESDYYRNPHHDRFQISIHALLAESDRSGRRGERRSRRPDFYPRSPCGERRPAESQAAGTNRISIHALLAESDQ